MRKRQKICSYISSIFFMSQAVHDQQLLTPHLPETHVVGDFRVGRACMCPVSNSMPRLRAEMSRMQGTWNGMDMSDRF